MTTKIATAPRLRIEGIYIYKPEWVFDTMIWTNERAGHEGWWVQFGFVIIVMVSCRWKIPKVAK